MSHPIHLHCSFVDAEAAVEQLRDPRVLAAVDFSLHPLHAQASADPRRLRVPLEPMGPAQVEIWRGDSPATHGRTGDIAWAENGQVQFGALVLEERADLDVEAASAQAYAQLNQFIAERGYPHVLRIWNYLDALTEGEGDAERYRRFCVGRVRGLERVEETRLPAATCIGSFGGPRQLLVYWLAARAPGVALENPRQVSAYRYPRQYGPQSPSFARAMLPPPGSRAPLLLSGTASIVGHATAHHDDVDAQLAEIFVNIEALRGAAAARQAGMPADIDDAGTLLKVYVRDRQALPRVAAALDARFGTRVPRLLLHAEVCRRELAVEIEGVLGNPAI
ncbi:pteridine-dependent deoxygenase [Stenotrophomonas sp. HITSZ_GD]|uniref:chorismate transformation enzyme, FkbO/Hyg5 family n=1 Tax=Stenotrophomonas sp. HITSZ_GD TaxID=3037248 RepID=UPI00240E8A05|nr:pteridine-dependent deoxygenase [Stenotrophomonas sp. HITSZ_GD]MDG2525350.1 pteridine-dependent deoxygenase [Stenotrophomonas sp. HITSZ_GD]